MDKGNVAHAGTSFHGGGEAFTPTTLEDECNFVFDDFG
jgi:hypothetical protein